MEDFFVSPEAGTMIQGFIRSLAFLFALISPFLIGILAIQGIRLFLRRRTKKNKAFVRRLLLVKMAKEAEELASKEEAAVTQKKDLKEAIAIAETLYANLGGTGYSRGFTYWKERFSEFWTGKHQHLGLEIFVQQGLIYFVVVVPQYLVEYVEQQILAIYPTAQVELIADYNIFQPTSFVTACSLKLTQNTVLPIRTYRSIDADPLDGITNTLSKITPDEGVAIQILLRLAHPKWRGKAYSISKKMHDGKTFAQTAGASSTWLFRLFSIPFRILEFVFQSLWSGSKKSEEKSSPAKPEIPKQQQKEEEIIKLIDENAARIWFESNIRIIVSAGQKARAQVILRNILASFAQFTEHRISNSFRPRFIFFHDRLINDFIYRNFADGQKVILSSEELASIYHFPLPSSETPNIAWLTTRKAPPPTNLPPEGLILGKSSYRGSDVWVRIKPPDRRRHVYIIGKSGMGKSVLLENMARQDISEGRGVCVIDPHGDLVNDLLTSVPPERIDDVIYFDPGDTERPMGLNMLEARTPEEMDFITQEMIAMFYQLVSDPAMIGPMFEHSMRNAMFTLMYNKESPGTIADIPRILTDTDFQKYNLQYVTDPMVRQFWEKEMKQTSDQQKSEMLGYLISKVGRFVENTLMRNIIGQQKSAFDFATVMDEQKILLVNLSKGKVGDINSNLLGLIIVSKLTMAALRRANQAETERKDFYLYIDEFQNYITDSIATILSEARKYRLNLTIAHQYMGQLVKAGDPKIRDAVFGNVGTMIAFKIGIEDAEVIAKEFAPTVNAFDLVNVEKFHAYIKLLVDNQTTRAFTMMAVPPERGDAALAEKLKQLSRLKYGRDRALIEAEVLERTKLGTP